MDKDNIKSNLNSENKILIELFEKSYTYDKKSYKFDLLHKIISKHDWENLISEASRMMGHSLSKKKINDQISLPRFMIIIAIISVILTIIYMATLYSAANSESDSSALLIVSIISISAGTIISAILATYNFFRQIRTFHSLDEIMQSTMEEFIKGINNKFRNKLEFTYIASSKLIECNVLAKKVPSALDLNEERKVLMTTEANLFTDKKVEENGARQNY